MGRMTPSLSRLQQLAGELSRTIDMATDEERRQEWFRYARKLETDLLARISERATENDDHEQAR